MRGEGHALSGDDGELIDLLIDAIRAGDDWRDLVFWIVFAVGGSVGQFALERDNPPVPGSVGEIDQATHEVLSEDAYFEAIRGRLREITLSGLREDVLVRGVRDDIAAQLGSLADFGRGQQRRDAIKEHLEGFAGDPGEFRNFLAQANPLAAYLSDDEIEEDRLRMLSRFDPDPDGELRRLAQRDRWAVVVQGSLSDEELSVWLDANSQRKLRDR
jgi:hypothetical protein